MRIKIHNEEKYSRPELDRALYMKSGGTIAPSSYRKRSTCLVWKETTFGFRCVIWDILGGRNCKVWAVGPGS